MQISKRFIAAIKLGRTPAYEIAHRAALHPATLSKIISGAEHIKPNDHRVLAVAKVLGLKPDECFENGSEQERA